MSFATADLPHRGDADDLARIAASLRDFDTAIRYALLDAWGGHNDFQAKLRDAILKRQALDRLMIGFHGTSAAATATPPATA